jgi:hypothetical protein
MGIRKQAFAATVHRSHSISKLLLTVSKERCHDMSIKPDVGNLSFQTCTTVGLTVNEAKPRESRDGSFGGNGCGRDRNVGGRSSRD